MKKAFAVILILGFILSPFVVMGQDAKEILALKRDLVQEKIVRIQTQLELMKIKYQEGQAAVKALQTELKDLDDKLKTMEEPKETK
ncbi:MAG: hypothetical protein ABIH23_14840 [bacterium]